MPERFQDRINRYVGLQDRQLRLATKLLLIELLAKYFPDDKISLLDAYYNAQHQLILPGQLFVSISHSANLAACVISTKAPIGIDIEKMGPIEQSVSQYFFTEKEQLAPGSFYLFWTRKEAVLKAAGLGLDKVDLKTVCAAGQKVAFNKELYATASLELHPDYAACIASPCLQLAPIIIDRVLFYPT